MTTPVTQLPPLVMPVLQGHSFSLQWYQLFQQMVAKVNTSGTGSGSVTSITAGTGLSGGTITTIGTIAIANTAVTAGSYTNANLTVNAQGQITAAANGTGGGGTPGNPTALVGLTAINGIATSYIRSDGAPALNQTISPTMTGNWLFQPTSGQAIVVNCFAASGSPAFGVTIQSGGNTVFDFPLYVTNNVGAAVLAIVGDGSFAIGYNTVTNVISGTAAGNVTIAPPTSGHTLALSTSGASAYATIITGPAATQLGCTSLQQSGQAIWTNYSPASSNDYRWNASGVGDIFVLGNGPKIQGRGPVAAGLVDMTSDASSFTLTYVGVSGTPTCHWSRNGNQVTLEIDTATGTSTSTSFTATGVPASLQPTRTQLIALPQGGMTDSTGGLVIVTAVSVTASSGTLTFWKGGSTTGWTGSGTKGISNAITFHYLLN